MENRLIFFLKRNRYFNCIFNRFKKKNNLSNELKQIKKYVYDNYPYKELAQQFEKDLIEIIRKDFSIPKEQAKIIAKEISQITDSEMTDIPKQLDNMWKKNNVSITEEEKIQFEKLCRIFHFNFIFWEFYRPICFFFLVKMGNMLFTQKIDPNNIPVQCRMTTQKLYDILKKMPEDYALRLLEYLHCTNYTFDCLVNNFKDNKRQEFINIVHSKEVDISEISKICNYLQDYLYFFNFMIQNFKEQPKDNPAINVNNFLETASSVYEKNSNYGVDATNCEELSEEIYKINNDPEKSETNLQSILNVTKEFLKSILMDERFGPSNAKEQKVLNRILENPKYAGLYNEILDELKQEFILPDGYFDEPGNETERVCIDDIKDSIKVGQRFQDFINYVAEEGYIDNDILTKQSFAYRLTGRCRPDNLIEQIEWNTDKDPGSHFLYYIVKQLYYSNGRSGIKKYPDIPTGKYERIKLFFICDNYTVENPSAYANQIKQGLKNKIKEFCS